MLFVSYPETYDVTYATAGTMSKASSPRESFWYRSHTTYVHSPEERSPPAGEAARVVQSSLVVHVMVVHVLELLDELLREELLDGAPRRRPRRHVVVQGVVLPRDEATRHATTTGRAHVLEGIFGAPFLHESKFADDLRRRSRVDGI